MSQERAGTKPREQTFDFKLVSDILMQLNITRKNTKMYPKGHPRLEASFQRVMGLLNEHFNYSDSLALVITGDSLMLGEFELPKNNPVFRELASALHEKSIYSFTIRRGVTSGELQSMNRVLMDDPAFAMPGAPIAKRLAARGVTHVEAGTLEWREDDFTSESVVELGEPGSGTGAAGGSWETFVRNLLSKDAEDVFTGPDDGIELTNVDPKALAEFIHKLQHKQNLDLSYDKAVAGYVSEMSGKEAGLQRVKDTEVRASFVNLIHGLHAGIRSELLDKNLKFSKRSPDVSLDLLDTPRGKTVFRVLEKLNAAEREIDPIILELVDRLAEYQEAKGDAPAPSLEAQDTAEFERDVTAFLSSGNFRASADPRQRLFLAQAAQADILAERRRELVTQNAQALVEEVEPVIIASHYAWCLMDLLERAADKKSAEAYAQSLAALVTKHAMSGGWDLALDIWRELGNIMAATRAVHVAECCDKVKNQFWQPDNISLISQAILDYGVDKVGDLVEILKIPGARFAGQIVQTLALTENPAVRRVLLGLVKDMAVHTRPYILGLLRDETWQVARNMLMAVQVIEESSSTETVLELLGRPEPELRLEALKTLLVLGHSKSQELLVRHMDDPDLVAATGAIELAGYYPVSDVIVALVKIVKGRNWTNPEREFKRQKKAVESLAQIQSEYALMEMLDLVGEKRLIGSKGFLDLKVEIFRSLISYDSPLIDKFIEAGKKTKDPRIGNICQALESKRRKRKEK
jgi:hypothetical protein